MPPVPAALVGLELLSSAVVLTDRELIIRYLNPAAESLFAVSHRRMDGKPLACLLGPAAEALDGALRDSLRTRWAYTGQDLHIQRSGGESLHLDCTVSRTELADLELLLEFRPIQTHLRIAREEKLLQQQQINRELIRNLLHNVMALWYADGIVFCLAAGVFGFSVWSASRIGRDDLGPKRKHLASMRQAWRGLVQVAVPALLLLAVGVLLGWPGLLAGQARIVAAGAYALLVPVAHLFLQAAPKLALAHGLPVGGELDYLDEGTLAQALRARRPLA